MSILLQDIQLLSSWFIGSFAIGLVSGFLIGLFIIFVKNITYYR